MYRHVSRALVVALAFTLFAGLHARAVSPGNPAFERTWQRTDQPVAGGQVSRTWMWGPEANTGLVEEQYAEGPNGKRLVQYFDKTRMEITDPAANSNTIWYVTNGLLVVELMTGRLQLGHNAFEQHNPARVNVAGDANDPNGPTYATFASLYNAPSLPDGAPITQRVNRAGQVQDDPALASYNVRTAQHVVVPGIDHQVAGPFWAFMLSSGTVYEGGAYLNAALFPDPYYATGYPLTEAYWADVLVGGTERLVLMQCFERRCLTYTPGNPEGWQVEAGNVGQHYHTWRYDQIPGEDGDETPTPTATSTASATTTTSTSTATTTVTSTSTATATATATVTATATATGTATSTPVETPAAGFAYLRQWGGEHDPGSAMGPTTATAIDAEGNMYVLDTIPGRIQKYDRNGRFLLEWGSGGNGDGQFSNATGLVNDDAGYVYVADTNNSRIQKFSSDGAYVTQWPVEDDAGNPAYPGDVAYYGGVLAVTLHSGVYAAINRYDTSGAFIDASGTANLSNPRGLDYDDAGQLWVTEPFAGCQIHLFDASMVWTSSFGSCGVNDDQFLRNLDIAADDTYLYVTDLDAGRVKVFSFLGVYLGDIGPGGSAGEPGSYLAPWGIAVGPDFIVVADYDRHVALRFSAWDEGAAFEFEWSDDRRGAFDAIAGIALGVNGYVWVADAGLNQVSRWSPTGELVNVFGTTGTNPGQFDQPRDIAIDSAGRVYVLDQGNNRVQVFSVNGVYQAGWGTFGSGVGQFDAPAGIAIDANDNVYISDSGNYRIQVFTSAGVYLRTWGSQGNGNLEFEELRDIEVYDGKVYVLDSNLERVKVFSDTGAFIAQFGDAGSGPGEFDDVNRIAIDAAGTLYLTDRNNHRVQWFSSSGVHITTFGTNGAGDGELASPAGIAVAQNGNVFVADRGNHRIQVFKPVS